jgi:glycosyltransferase involved in cell wall biosynthesis
VSRRKGSVLVLAWTNRPGRALDLAESLGGEAAVVYPRTPGFLRHPFSTALRYALSTVITASTLVRLRPSAVVVTNPPLIPPLVVATWSALTRRPFLLDSHPSAFGAKGRWVVAKLQFVHRWLARAAEGVLVTTDERAAEVNGWGARGLVVHEAPVLFPPRRTQQPPAVLFVGVFAPDEPVEAVVEAARLVPDVQFQITGDVSQAPSGLLDNAPPNVSFVGYLGAEDYRQCVADATVLLTLTTEPSSVMRSAYEAVYARTPLITTGTPALRELFPHAVFCDNTAESVRDAVVRALADKADLESQAEAALALQDRRWALQRAELAGLCGL